MVNVIQSVLLTEGEKMIKTPTYHVFHMYQYHQDADLVAADLFENEEVGTEENPVPALNASVSVKNGIYTITAANMDPDHSYPLELRFTDFQPKHASGSVVTEEMHAKNTFEEPDCVTEKALENLTLTPHGVKTTIPACAVLMIRLS